MQEKLRKKVASLLKKQKTYQLKEIVKGQDTSRPWGQENQVKVFVVIIDILLDFRFLIAYQIIYFNEKSCLMCPP